LGPSFLLTLTGIQRLPRRSRWEQAILRTHVGTLMLAVVEGAGGRRSLRRFGMLSHRASRVSGEHARSIEPLHCCWSVSMPSAAPMRQKSTSGVPGQSCRGLSANQSSKRATSGHP